MLRRVHFSFHSILKKDCTMHLTLNSLTALRIMRAIRCGKLKMRLTRRCDLIAPDKGQVRRWTGKALAKDLAFLGNAVEFSEKRPLDVLVPAKNQRLRLKGVSCSFRTCQHPANSFVHLGNGIAMSCPELMFIELARVMDPVAHLLLGMELCGRFSRSSDNPRFGMVAYDIEPVTSVERLRAYAREAHAVRGASQALGTIDRICENAWLPMEAIIAALAMLPLSKLGYDLWPIGLNPRKELGERLSALSDAESRVPDIMFCGTGVGLNYDGEDHFRLFEVVQAAMALERDPGNSDLVRELDEALGHARAAIVSDKRRDRDLMSLGLSVFSMTKEDLAGEGGLDRVMGQIIEAIERSGSRSLLVQRAVLQDLSLARARQDLIWSLMPGPVSADARKRLEEWSRQDRFGRHDYAITFEVRAGELMVISTREL